MTRPAPHPFWQFSLRTYGKPGVEQACLRLQDHHGADVNLVLLCCWAAVIGRGPLDTERIRAAMSATERWQAEIIGPLRAARRSLKRDFEGVAADQCSELRKSIGRAELECEHAEQLLLARQVEALPQAPEVDPALSARTSIEGYLAALGARLDKTAQEDIDTVIAAGRRGT
ncbi:MAG: TIGR02444 family protein [Betaproteobacteria bacterium]|nr:TIGR02444 family protein [Betaproteobacteria bacterium]MBI2961808.1 TIGR02444 family protein [Betaproteobacteria bacterium]